MDSRVDEQERGITMKSSAITLFFSDKDQETTKAAETTNENEYIVNLIDTPGTPNQRLLHLRTSSRSFLRE